MHMREFVRSLYVSSQREDFYPMLGNGQFPFSRGYLEGGTLIKDIPQGPAAGEVVQCSCQGTGMPDPGAGSKRHKELTPKGLQINQSREKGGGTGMEQSSTATWPVTAGGHGGCFPGLPGSFLL